MTNDQFDKQDILDSAQRISSDVKRIAGILLSNPDMMVRFGRVYNNPCYHPIEITAQEIDEWVKNLERVL